MTARYGDSQSLAHLRTACAPRTATHTSNKKQDSVPGVWKRAGLAHWSVLLMHAAAEPIFTTDLSHAQIKPSTHRPNSLPPLFLTDSPTPAASCARQDYASMLCFYARYASLHCSIPSRGRAAKGTFFSSFVHPGLIPGPVHMELVDAVD